MAEWAVARRAHRVRRDRGRSRLFVLLIVMVCALAWYAHRHRHVPWEAAPRTPIVGVPRIIDGDTVDVARTRIRLEAIDAPEMDQTCRDAQGRPWTCGAAAGRELRRQVNRQELRCAPSGLDRFKRVLATCFLPDGTDLNGWMVRQGWALAFRSMTRYRAEQREAEAAKRGLWAGTFVLPWEWRDRGR